MKVFQKIGRLCVVMLAISSIAYSKTELIVYTAIETELLNEYKTRFESKHPDININWVRDSTGIITAKLLAERDAPKADIVLGVAASSLLILEEEDLLVGYKPHGYEKISDDMKDLNDPPKWIGTMAWATSLCINKIEMKKNNLPYPTDWNDLLNPIYKGYIAMPHPASSGTGFMDVTAWMQILGEEEAWNYMKALHKNIKEYSHSGTKPCAMAAQGEVAIGLSSSSFAQKLIKRRAPIELWIPTGGLGWELEAAAIIKGTPRLEAAQKMMDWVTSDDVGEIGQEFSGITARPDYMTEEGKQHAEGMIDNNLSWAAQNRERILKKWRSLFDAQ